MSDYWKKKLNKLNESNPNKSASSDNYWKNRQAELDKKKSADIAPIRSDIITVKTPQITAPLVPETGKRTWFQKGEYFSDGSWDAGDLTKTILSSANDLGENLQEGFLRMGETALDGAMWMLTALNEANMNKSTTDKIVFNTVTGNAKENQNTLDFNEGAKKEVKKEVEEFIEKDLYDEKEVARRLLLSPSDFLKYVPGVDAEKVSVFGEKSDSLAQSAGQLVATATLQATGVPWFLTTGFTSFGGEVENALNQDATFEQAGASAFISAGAEILTEKLSGGIKFGGKTLDDVLVKPFTEQISNKVLKTLVNFGIDALGEGTEEVISGIFSNLGTALYKEKDLSEILLSEEALNEYLEGFLGGMFLGGASSIVTGGANGSDVNLTELEQKVVDKVVEDRISEETKDGKKLTKAEEKKIREEVLGHLEKGYIDTDTIESVLGGEEYLNYKNANDSKAESEAKLNETIAQLKEEYKTLNKMKRGDMTGEQQDRQAEIKEELSKYNAELEALKGDSSVNQLKTKLGNVVSDIAKSSRLGESYNEKSRRSQAFEADLTKYDAKQQETVKKAVESGILNNTNRTHDFVDMIAKISADKGVSFDFINNQKLKESGFALEGKAVNGYVTVDGNVAINIDSVKSLNTVVGHEITHILEGTELYNELQQTIVEYAKAKGEYQSRYDAIAKLYEGIEGANIDNELAADLVGDYLFTDSDFVSRLSTENRNVFQKIYDEIKYLCRVATAGSKEAKQLEKVKRTFEKAYRETKAEKNTAEGSVRYSVQYEKATVNNDIVSLVEKVKNKDYKDNDFVDLGIVSDKAAGEIKKILGVDVSGYRISVEARQIKHILKDHGEQGRTDHSMADDADIGKMEYVFQNFDSVVDGGRTEAYFEMKNGHNRTARTVLYEKEIGEKSYYIVQAVPETKRKTLFIVSTYIGKKGQKKKSLGSSMLKSPDATSTTVASVTSDNSIPNSSKNVKQKDVFGFKIDENADVDEDLLEELSIYHPDAEVDSEGNVTVYHRTSKANAEKIRKTGVMTALEDALFFSSKSEGYASDYGDTVLTFKIPSTVLRVNDIFSGEVHFDVPLKRMNNQWSMNVSKYLVNENVKQNGNLSLSSDNPTPQKYGNYNVYGDDVRYQPDDIAPVREDLQAAKPETMTEDIAPVREDITPKRKAIREKMDYITEFEETNAKVEADEAAKNVAERPTKRSELHHSIVENIKAKFTEKGFDFDKVLKNAKNLSTFSTVDNTPQRVMEKALGYKQGQILADETVNKVAQNESEGIKWLNSFTDRKNGVLAQISNKYKIKPGSKESAAAQMYAEGFYMNEKNEYVKYGDRELAQDFPDAKVRANIKGLAEDPQIRQIYDETLAAINEARSRNLYPEIPRLDNYFLHFRAMEDTFSRLGLPFNPNDIRAKDLPTDLNGVTADLKPGQPYFASAMKRRGVRTTHDLLGGLERYLASAKNQIYHIDDIQKLRAIRNYIADTYGQAKGLEGIDELSDAEAQERIEQIYGSHLSTFAKFLNEEANVIAGKTALIDRGLEGFIGRRGITFIDTVNKQVGSNMVGFNISSSLTNFLPVVQTFAKTNKFDFIKAFAQTASNKLNTIFRKKSDGFAENSPVMIRRKGADRFYRTPFQKFGDTGYILMSAVDDISTELIARTKYNELTRKGMDSQKAHFETDKWVSRLMGDRSLGQMPQLYNSKMLGLITKFQLEVRNQLDSMTYDTIQEAKVSNEAIENKLLRNAKTAAKVGFTFFQLAVNQHLFGMVFESVAGYNPAFDIIDVLIKACGFDDDEEDDDTALDNVEEAFFALLEDLPYTSTFTGGRIPISSAMPIEQLVKGEDDYGNEKSRLETLKEIAPYYVLPTGYGQIKKTVQGLQMFDDDLPVSGSYTDSGNLRFPVEETPVNRIKAGLFGQYANENARAYFDNDIAPLKEKQIEEYKELDLPIADYWEIREGLSRLEPEDGKTQVTLNQKGDYIGGLDLPTDKKNILINNVADRDEPIDMTDYHKYSDFEEFDFATRYPDKYKVLQEQGISVKEYKEKYEETAFMYTDDFSWAANNPEKYEFSKVVTDDVIKYRKITSDLYNIKADKDENGKSISGSRKKKVVDFINGLDIDNGAKYILFKSEYNSDDTYNYEIINYLNNRDDISYTEMKTILEELGFKVDSEGNISW